MHGRFCRFDVRVSRVSAVGVVTGRGGPIQLACFALPRVAARVSLCQIFSLLFACDACAGRRADAPGYDPRTQFHRKTQLTGVGSESEISPAVAKVKGAEGVREEEEQEGHGGEVVHACERMGQFMGQLASRLMREPASAAQSMRGVRGEKIAHLQRWRGQPRHFRRYCHSHRTATPAC